MVGDFPFMLSLVEAFLGVFQQHRDKSSKIDLNFVCQSYELPSPVSGEGRVRAPINAIDG